MAYTDNNTYRHIHFAVMAIESGEWSTETGHFRKGDARPPAETGTDSS